MKIILAFILFLLRLSAIEEHTIILQQFEEKKETSNNNNNNIILPFNKELSKKFPHCNISEVNSTKIVKLNIKNEIEELLNFEEAIKNKEEIIEIKTSFLKNKTKYIWFNKDLSFNKRALDIIVAIKKSQNHALNPDFYHKKEIFSLTKKLLDKKFKSLYEKNQTIKKLEILFTDAYILLIKDLRFGISDWNETVRLLKKDREKFEWLRDDKNFNVLKYAISNLKNNRVKESIENLIPKYKDYKNLKKALSFYREIEKNGGFPKIPYGKIIRLNQKDKRIPLIRKRLSVTSHTIDPKIYDKKLFLAVKDFQRRFQIFPSGRIDKRTIKALNIPVEKIIDKIKLNMERYRWLPKKVSSPYIDINIPSFLMKVKNREKTILSIPVIVGKKERPTPVFTSYLSSIILNPYWHVPKTIVQKDLLKKLQKNPETFSQKNIHIYDSWKLTHEINANEINWYQFSEKDKIPFVFVQDPGIHNPLGRVKFQFSNPFAVFMHDTPNKTLFKRRYRYFSSGCIRLQNPMKLLRYILKKEGKDFISIKNIIESGKNDTIVLKNKIPILIDYFTAKANDKGRVIFYKDIYNYDKIQLFVLKSKKMRNRIKFASNLTSNIKK